MSAIIDTLTATLQAAPDSWQCRLALVEAFVAEDRADEAYQVLSNVTELPADAESCVMAARAYGLLEPDSGIEILDGVIASDPTFAPAYLEKAKLCFAKDEIELASRQYAAAITFDPALADPGFADKLGISSPETEVAVQTEPTDPGAPPAAVEETEVPVLEEENLAHVGIGSPVPEPATEPAVYYPAPGEYPTMTLREALQIQNIEPLIAPASVPEHPSLSYVDDVHYVETNYTDEEHFRQQLHNVEVHTAYHQIPVEYNYQAPDDSIFEPTITPDDIYVSALVTESGEQVARLEEMIRRNRAEKEAEITRRERTAKIQSLIVALITISAVIVMMAYAVVAVPRPAPPQIVATSVVSPAEEALEKTTIKQVQTTPTPRQSASAMSMEVMTVASASSLSMMSFDSPAIDLGAASLGTDFGSSMSFGDTAGGSSVMFFGGKSTGKRFLFILDASISMKDEQIKLRNDELERTLKTLRGVDYQVMLFAGGAYYADKGWALSPDNPKTKTCPELFVSPHGKYAFKGTGLFKFDLLDEKEFRSPDWKKASASAVRRTIEFVRKSKKFGGTDWDNALRMGHMMKPPPDVIFFMSDGLDNELNEKEILRNNKKNGRPKINCVAMQTAKGSGKFAAIAKGSRGTYTIVDKDGESIDGFEYMNDPASFAGRLKF
ncbi:MAG: hypothetical protein P1V20_15365 [Verrucomicrobiales bacterium]|nr:hypothetical protein [Verrucomicrobiales bacterium]